MKRFATATYIVIAMLFAPMVMAMSVDTGVLAMAVSDNYSDNSTAACMACHVAPDQKTMLNTTAYKQKTTDSIGAGTSDNSDEPYPMGVLATAKPYFEVGWRM